MMKHYELLQPLYKFPSGTFCTLSYWEGKGSFMILASTDTSDTIWVWLRDENNNPTNIPDPNYFKLIKE